MLRFCSLASGSQGNATLVEAFDGTHHTRVLIDCGLGERQLNARLSKLNLSPAQLDGIFLTHEHGDHTGCALAVSARWRVPIWTSAGTWGALAPKTSKPKPLLNQTPAAPPPVHLCSDGQTVHIGGLQLHPFTVPHDAREPLQLTCSDGNRRLGILTDLGHVTAHALAQLANCHALLLESNHCPDLLADSHYPPFLKRRVGGSHGHLSNPQAAAALKALSHPALHTVVGAHLSEHNNRPALVQASFAQVLGCAPDEVLLSSRHGLDWSSV
ncbi:MBL fold metallo-hydrolase [Ottowia sp.]|uniref:MBL fold metallo-hydrolase n=1 Tax=Ottowia sp. TaxID=1898956 RepID=UPI003A898272